MQAMFPHGSLIIPNALGTAPGIDLSVTRPRGTARVFALPGVPAEMFEMFANWVAPAVSAMQPQPRMIRHHRIKCFGAGESQVEQMLPDLIRRGREPSVGITVHAATITLRISATGRSEEECLAAMQPTIDTIHGCLGSLVYGQEDDELEDVVVRLLAQRGQTVATVEAGTQGQLAQVLYRAAGPQGCYRGGLIVTDAAVACQTLLPAGVVVGADAAATEEGVSTLANAARHHFATDFALAMGAFPNDTAQEAAPYYFALATATEIHSFSGTLISHPSIWKPRAAKQALNLLRLSLQKALPKSGK